MCRAVCEEARKGIVEFVQELGRIFTRGGRWEERMRGEPKIASAGERLVISCGEERKELRNQGRRGDQSDELQRARRVVLRRR